nr:hypothetical protein [Pararhizobium capsulatum]
MGLVGGVALVPVEAQEPAPGRYSMQRAESGIARLDTQTGEVSLCQDKDGQMVCRLAADERTAFELELDLLTKRVETLENALQDGQFGTKPRLPTDEEIDQTMGIMERMLRGFMGIVKDLEGDEHKAPGALGEEPRKT